MLRAGGRRRLHARSALHDGGHRQGQALGGARVLGRTRWQALSRSVRQALRDAAENRSRRAGAGSGPASACRGRTRTEADRSDANLVQRRAQRGRRRIVRRQDRRLRLGRRRPADLQVDGRPRRDRRPHRVGHPPRRAAPRAAVQRQPARARPRPVHGQLQLLQVGRRAAPGYRGGPVLREAARRLGRRGGRIVHAGHAETLRPRLRHAEQGSPRDHHAQHLPTRSVGSRVQLRRIRTPGRLPVRAAPHHRLARPPAGRYLGRVHRLHQSALRLRHIGGRDSLPRPH